MTLLTGTAIAQIIPVAISPLLTRLYSPDEIGVYTIFFATTNILAIFISGRFDQAILISKHKKDNYETLKLVLAYSFIISIILFIVLLCFKTYIFEFLGISSLGYWGYLIPITGFLIALFQSYNYWLNRNDKYLEISKGKVIQGVFTAIIHVASSILNVIGLVLGRFLGILMSSMYLLIASRKFTPKNVFINDYESLKQKLDEHKSFPLYTMPNALLNSVSNNLPVYLLENLYSAKVTGFYSWSVRIIQGPMGMLTASIQQVFFRKASELYNNGENLLSLTKQMYQKLFLIGIIPYTLIFIFAPDIFAFVFGPTWRVAGEYTMYLVPWFFIMFLNSPISSLILILKKQKQYLIFEIALLIFRAISLLLGYYLFNDPELSVILYSIVGFIFNILLSVVLLKLSKNA
ncbi:lipopolysaccharide biosynthesis protein [uncultured Aquimarina sp.]|uniref:lipopolysaccharide biosynthesis protein n=1 Tax=uncultured Aquimarina sp. TaxID=575652 RepID=UPI00345C0C86